MIAFLGRLRDSWQTSCRAGTPVPESHRCAALHCESVPLVELTVGMRGTVSCLQQPESRSVARLAAFGVLPGVEIVLLQRSPAFVVRLGYAEYAMDDAVASHIRVIVDR
jgi:ferrous iron transport protein A